VPDPTRMAEPITNAIGAGVPLQRLRGATVRGILWFGGDQFGRRVVDQIFAVVLARMLFPKDYGVFALAAVFLTFLRIIGSMGMGSAVIQRREVDEEYLSTGFWASVTLGVILAAIGAASGFLIGRWLGDPLVGRVLSVLSLSFLIIAGASMQMAIVSRSMDYRLLAFRSMAATLIGGVIGISMAYRGMGVWSFVGQELAMYASGTLLLWRATGWRPRFVFVWSKFLELWSFGGRLQAAALFDYLVRQMDNLLIGRYLGATALGYYTFGYSVFLAPLNDIGMLNRVFFPALSRLQDDASRFKAAFIRATQYVTMVALPMLVGLALVAPLAVSVVFGAKWLPSLPVIRLLTLAGILRVLTAFWPTGLQATGRPDLRLRLSLFSVALYLPAFVVGLRWGIIGVAAGYLVATVMLLPVAYRYVSQTIGITVRDVWRAISTTVIGCIVMAAAVAALMWAIEVHLHLPNALALVVLVTVGAVIYAAALWLIEPQVIRGLVRAVAEVVPGRRSSGRREAPQA